MKIDDVKFNESDGTPIQPGSGTTGMTGTADPLTGRPGSDSGKQHDFSRIR
tara:strand:- start:2218 stop:2370 length:153 start_codon:yes stop_codon:yes gene_type:complete